MVFNKKYSKILQIAADKDPELAKVIKYMLSKLNEEQKNLAYNGEEFREGNLALENFDKTYLDVDLEESYLILNDEHENGVTNYELNLTNITKEWLDKIENLTSIDLLAEERLSTELLFLDVTNYALNGDILGGKTYGLEVCKVNGEYLLYYTRAIDDVQKNIDSLEAESITTIEKEELDNIADLGDSVSL